MGLMYARLNTALLVVLICVGLAILTMLATRAQGGPLDPPGAPASTQRPIDELNGAWSRKLLANDGETACNSSRFRCVLDNQAVLDRETGLVWMKSPYQFFTGAWGGATGNCADIGPGGRLGWRLPAVEELASLIDSTQLSGPALPAGHPFTNVQDRSYWTATTFAGNATRAFVIDFIDELNTYQLISVDKSDVTGGIWCVRGGQSAGAYAP